VNDRVRFENSASLRKNPVDSKYHNDLAQILPKLRAVARGLLGRCLFSGVFIMAAVRWRWILLMFILVASPQLVLAADEPKMATLDDVTAAKKGATQSANMAWILISTALVLVMLPGLALFYGGMVRRKNILGTMMHTMGALGLVGVQWVVCGYSLAFGDSQGGFVGWSKELCFLSTDAALSDKYKIFPNTDLPLYLHAMFQGMFAIITVALISGAFAERVKFSAYCLFSLLWTTLVYDPLAHWVWSASWVPDENGDLVATGWLGSSGALDFAGGTVVHIAAGVSGLTAVLLLKKRSGYGKQVFHPNNMVLTLLGAGLLWFGWFGFNGGSALASTGQAVSALTVTQVAAAAAGLAWLIVEWLHRGKPTALGFASGLVAGLVAITPASGFVAPGGALLIGILSGVICYWAVAAKSLLGYDDSLDAFGIHGVGGMLGAVLTGALVSLPLWAYGTGLEPSAFPGKLNEAKTAVDVPAQIQVQLLATVAATVYSFLVTAVLVLGINATMGFTLKPEQESIGLDLTQHGEIGVDVGPDLEAVPGSASSEPKPATTPRVGLNDPSKRFSVLVEGAATSEILAVWSEMCKKSDTPPKPEFSAVYPYITTVSENKFRFRGGDPIEMKRNLQILFDNALEGRAIVTHVEH
jgi:ammonium transporter